jgi:hypothetical protein
VSVALNENESNAVILTRGVERVFRKLICFLVGKISLVKLQEMIRNIYVEESERKLRTEKPGRDVSLTRLALITGLDTRTLAKIRNDEQYRKPLHEQERFVKTMTPESCVLDVWLSSPKYCNVKTGEPRILDLMGIGKTFEELVGDSVSSRGVTVQSILASLVNLKAVDFDEENQTIKLLEKTLAPYKVGNRWGVFDVGIVQICNLLDTSFHNFEVATTGGQAFFARGAWTVRLPRREKVEFQKKIRRFLEDSEMKARKKIELFEESESTTNQITAGLHMFYFEEDVTGL